MPEKKHTAGPWRYEAHLQDISWLVGPDAPLGPIGPQGTELTGIHVAAIAKDSEANARLIAAAPDLLEALEGLVEDVERTRSDFWGLPTQVRNSSVAKAEAAISKAKGDV